MLVRGGELIVDDQLITLREVALAGARRRDEAWISGRVVDVEPEVPHNGAGVIRRQWRGAAWRTHRHGDHPPAANAGPTVMMAVLRPVPYMRPPVPPMSR